MAATSRRQYSYAPAQQKTLPISMPAKAPAYHYPVSRIAMSPSTMSESSTTHSGSRSSGQSYSARSSSYAASQSSDYDSYNSASGVDVVDMLSERMNSAFDPIRMDKSLAKQAQASGALNDKQRELAELQAKARSRLAGARQNMAQGMEAARETRRDLDYIKDKTASMKAKAERRNPEAYAKASRRTYDDEY